MERPSVRRQLNLLFIGLLIGAAFTVIVTFGLPGGTRQPAPTTTSSAGTPGAVVAPEVGALAPAFTLQDIDGQQVSLSDFNGHPVLLNFWAVWCAPCAVEMPLLDTRYRTLEDQGLVVLGINFDDPVEDVRIYGDSLDISFPLLLDPGGEVQDLYRIRGYPSTILVDADGVVRMVQVGLMSEEQLDSLLEAAGF